jgi:hypothetical protein
MPLFNLESHLQELACLGIVADIGAQHARLGTGHLKQGFGQPNEFGPNAPTALKALLGFLRARGYAMIDEVFAHGEQSYAIQSGIHTCAD